MKTNKTSRKLTFARLASLSMFICCTAPAKPVPTPPTAPFEDKTNGVDDPIQFGKDEKSFSKVDNILDDGLGPVYNATSCVSCHQNPVTGSSSEIQEIRAGHLGKDPKNPSGVAFISHPGGSLVHQRATNPQIQEHVLAEDKIRTFRMSNTILGDGYVECISDLNLIGTVQKQISEKFGDMRGTIVLAPVADSVTSSQERVGRFGWKCQQASLLNFAADAYINEMGVTSPLQPKEDPSDQNDVTDFDPLPEVNGSTEDKTEEVGDDGKKIVAPFGVDVEAFTRFMRSLSPPPRADKGSKAQADSVERGEKLFRDSIKTGCAICHVADWKTMPETAVLPGNFKDNHVPLSLADKIIHPYSDFLLHDIGTGDGIAQLQHAQFPSPSSLNVTRLEEKMTALKTQTISPSFDLPTDRIFHLRDAKLTMEQTVNLLKLLPSEKQIPRDIISGEILKTANMLRTAPLWGLRVRPRLLHDGSALTIDEAIRRHQGQAYAVRSNYVLILTVSERNDLLAFLKSL